jgi:hypothetical protein
MSTRMCIKMGRDNVISSTFLTERGQRAKKGGCILKTEMYVKIKKINLVSCHTLMIPVANTLAGNCDIISVWCHCLERLKRVTRL